MRRLLVAVLACGSVALAGPPLASAQSSLDAVVLNGTAQPTLDCQPSGTSTVTYTMEGDALGPFPGTFEETGSFTIAGGQVASFDATFTITSGTTVITGTKTLRTSSSGVCQVDPEPGVVQFTEILLDATYNATITTPSGSSTDNGRAVIDAQMNETPTSASGSMQESFVSEGLVHTSGHVVGAGIIEEAEHDRLVFALTAKSNGTTAQAKCTVLTAGTFVKCLNATLLMQTSTHVTFVGQALVNGVEMGYRIDLDDFAHPGHGQDTFEIQTDGGFHAEGTLVAGNVKIFD